MNTSALYSRLPRASLALTLVTLTLGITGCQSKPVAPPPGETPQAVSPVAAVPINPVVPTTPDAAQIPSDAANTPAKPVAAPVPQLPAAAPKVKQLSTTTKAQCAVVGLGDQKGRVKGSLILTELADGGVSISGIISGLTPGLHGFHVHEHGDCGSADGMSAGGHFNPTKAPHGDTEATHSHMGDLGNIKADASGRAFVEITKKPATLGTGPSSFLGRSLIVHGGADDLTSQPAGESGHRVGCGVIKPMS